MQWNRSPFSDDYKMYITIRESLSILETTQNYMCAENEDAEAWKATHEMQRTYAMWWHRVKISPLSKKKNPWLESYLYNKNREKTAL